MKKYWILVVLFLTGLIASGIHPKEMHTWVLEVFPAVIGLIVLALTFNNFRFTYFAYIFILIHCYILFVGGHWTYAHVPLFDAIRDLLHQSRNNYDKVGHFAQGFVPAVIARELFVRRQIVKRGIWLSVLVVCTCLSISVMYEFLEWAVALLAGGSATEFLGTQGYEWDTQSDMFWALIGAVCMVTFFGKIHDKYIHRIASADNQPVGK